MSIKTGLSIDVADICMYLAIALYFLSTLTVLDANQSINKIAKTVNESSGEEILILIQKNKITNHHVMKVIPDTITLTNLGYKHHEVPVIEWNRVSNIGELFQNNENR